MVRDAAMTGGTIDGTTAATVGSKCGPPDDDHIWRCTGRAIPDRWPVGHCAIAEVYRGFDQVLARSVAVKVFHPGISNQLNVAGQRAEMQVLANLQHPNLLRVDDARFGDAPVGDVLVTWAPPATSDLLRS